jgi:Methyltransferase domain
MRLRDRFVDSPTSIGAKLRSKRQQLFADTFPDLAQLSVLDLGGTAEFWKRAPIRPAHVRVVNLVNPGEAAPGIETVVGDACDLSMAADGFDLVFSNSVIEHVGGHVNRARMAEVVRRAAPRHWVQTPYRYFPIEPHFLFPGMQFAPLPLRARIARSWPLVHSRPADIRAALDCVLWVELIGRTEMTRLFPDSRVIFERIAGVPKSMVAIRA